MNVNVSTTECKCPNLLIRVPEANIKKTVCDPEFNKSVDQGRFHCSHMRGEI
jgi:hypothetical protein